MIARPDNDALSRDEQAAHWCLAFAEGELPEAEQAAFDIWIADQANAQALEDAIGVWKLIDKVAESPEVIQWRSAALDSFRSANRNRWGRRLSSRWYWGGGIAAMFVAALCGALALQVRSVEYQTGIGERRVAMLADGSKLSLDGDSEVRVRLLKGRRELMLVHGRAKFDVAKDPLRPFSVAVGDRIVVATGTSFSVEMLSDQMRVSLYEGHVAVLNQTDGRPVRGRGANVAADVSLIPGRELRASLDTSSSATVIATDPPRSLAWEAGQLSFDEEPLGSAIEQVNRYSETKLVIADPRIAGVRVSGLFTAGDTTAFVDALSSLSSVKAERRDHTIVLRRE